MVRATRAILIFWVWLLTPPGLAANHSSLLVPCTSIRDSGGQHLDSLPHSLPPPHAANRHDAGCDGSGLGRLREQELISISAITEPEFRCSRLSLGADGHSGENSRDGINRIYRMGIRLRRALLHFILSIL